MKLGKAPFTPDERDLKFATYATDSLPEPPAVFGHEGNFPAKGWGMLGNEEYGDCVWAGAAHETMLLNSLRGNAVSFSTTSVLADYSAVTGFDPNVPSSDRGTDVREAIKYRHRHGVSDAAGKRHRIGAYVQLEAGNLRELYQAAYLFEVVGIGIRFPASAMDQFHAGQAWDVVPGAQIEGGHYVPVVGRDGFVECVTWGQLQPMTEGFYEQMADEAWCFISHEALTDHTSVEGFDVEALRADLAALRS